MIDLIYQQNIVIFDQIFLHNIQPIKVEPVQILF